MVAHFSTLNGTLKDNLEVRKTWAGMECSGSECPRPGSDWAYRRSSRAFLAW